MTRCRQRQPTSREFDDSLELCALLFEFAIRAGDEGKIAKMESIYKLKLKTQYEQDQVIRRLMENRDIRTAIKYLH